MRKTCVKKALPVLFLLFFSLCCYTVALFGKYLLAVRGTDSVLQMMYFVPFLQKALLSCKGFWSWSYGLGGDIYSGFSYYYSTSPFFYISMLLKALGIGKWDFANTLQWKLAFVIFKQFLSMLFMYLLLQYEKRREWTSLIGAMAYGGCICYMCFSVSFDFMTDAFVWVPLVVLGILRYRDKGKWLLFVISAALCAANNFYLGFMSFVLFAAAILVFAPCRGKTIKEKSCSYIKLLSKYLLLGIMALCLSAAAFFPAVTAFTYIDRFNNNFSVPLFYDISTLEKLPENIFYYTGNLGLPLVALLVFFLPWRKLRSDAKRKTVLAGIFFILFLLPISCSFFNGFSYMSQRWFYLFIFTVAFALPDWLEENERLKHTGLRFFIFIAAALCIMLITQKIRGVNFTYGQKTFVIPDVVLIVASLVSVLAVSLKKHFSAARVSKVLSITAVVSVALCLILNTNIYLLIRNLSVTSAYLSETKIESQEKQSLFSNLTPSSNEFYRTIYRGSGMENEPLYLFDYGTSSYSSMLNGNLHRWLKVDCDILNQWVCPNRFINFDDRLFLETAFGVKYIVTDSGDTFKPYGYILKQQTGSYNVYENQYNIGFDLWYDTITSESSYKSMNVAQRDALLLESAVVENSIDGIKEAGQSNATHSLELNYADMTAENATFENGVITAGKNAVITIPFNNAMKDKNGEILFTLTLNPVNGHSITMTVNGKTARKAEESYAYAYPLNTYTFRLDGSTESLSIKLSEGKYSISGAAVYFNSYENYSSLVGQRNKYNLENLKVDGGYVSGTINNGEKGILALNIPYCNGWTATVDGKKADIIKVNTVFTGLVLEPGRHTVILTYRTPGLIAGICISSSTAVLIMLFIIIKHLFIKKKTAAGN